MPKEIKIKFEDNGNFAMNVRGTAQFKDKPALSALTGFDSVSGDPKENLRQALYKLVDQLLK